MMRYFYRSSCQADYNVVKMIPTLTSCSTSDDYINVGGHNK